MHRSFWVGTGVGTVITAGLLAILWNQAGFLKSPRPRANIETTSATLQLRDFLRNKDWEDGVANLGAGQCSVLFSETTRILNALGADYRTYSPEVKEILADWQELEVAHFTLGRTLFERTDRELATELDASPPPDIPNGLDLHLDALSYPAVDGSTSTYPLARLIACRLLDVPYGWTANPIRDFSARHFGGMQAGDYQFITRDLRADPGNNSLMRRKATLINGCIARHSGTNQAYINLIQGKADLILVAREPSSDELDLARTRLLDVRPVALDAFVFMVNAANPVEGLTTEQIRSIYTGQITHWPEPWKEKAVHGYIRDRNSGSQELMDKLIMNGTPFHEKFRYEDMLASGMGGPFHRLREDQFGLGFSVYYYAHFMTVSPATRLIAVDGVHPNRETIANRRYPYVTAVFVAIRNDLPEEHDARRLRDWLLSEEGQAVVAESGYIPIGKS